MGNPFYNNFNSSPDAEAQMFIFFPGFVFILRIFFLVPTESKEKALGRFYFCMTVRKIN